MATANRRDRGKKTTIIRRQIKKSHAGHHGGAWKVAFADFTLAMMALFMTLWIVNSVSQSDREEIVAALHGQSIFFGGGMAPLSHLPRKVATLATGSHGSEQARESDRDRPARSDENQREKMREASNAAMRMRQKSARELGELANSINEIALKAHMESNLEMEIVPQGLRILIKDNQKRSMFERGSATIMPFFRSLLTELTPVFNSLDNRLIITGHTDAMRYKGAGYNNWNLSGDRALSARRVMGQAGMPEDKVMQVSAMADRMLLDAHNPQGADNRRIEIMVLTHTASDTLYQFFGAQGEKIVKPLASKLEQASPPGTRHEPD
ncbi:putative lateral flagellar export/assembly protein LafU [Pseudescherichia sp.]|uniref:putative lateral flagellar export/assembly protein LafU n=1 Tax=Pseudescherichia sp. TaxID=2055881 RepID=UPI00289EE053|nr:putative lateral flagellar export/assembly protein LafU [Pseudescherichia sp.]